REVLACSAFVSPTALNGNHSIWSYRQPGLIGYANPQPERIDSEDFDAVLRACRERARKENLLGHLRGLAASLEPGVLFPPEERAPDEFRARFPEDDAGRAQGMWDLFGVGAGIGSAGA